MEKWQEENNKLLELKKKLCLYEYDHDITNDDYAELLLQIYNSTYVLQNKITPLMQSTLCEIQYAIRSPQSRKKHDRQARQEIDRLKMSKISNPKESFEKKVARCNEAEEQLLEYRNRVNNQLREIMLTVENNSQTLQSEPKKDT